MVPRARFWNRWLAVAAFAAAMPVLSSFALDGEAKAPLAPGDVARRVPQPDAAPRAAGDDSRRGGPRRELTDQDIDRIVQTARDIDPSWGDALQVVRAQDAAGLRQRIGSQARMLIGLAAIRDRQPELYRARVDDFRVQRQLRSAAERAIKARETSDAAGEAQAMAEVRDLASRQFELDMKARAYELVAMERALKDARRRLQEDIAERDTRLQDVIGSVERGEMPKFGRGPEGAGFGSDAPWRRRDGDAPRNGDAGAPSPKAAKP